VDPGAKGRSYTLPPATRSMGATETSQGRFWLSRLTLSLDHRDSVYTQNKRRRLDCLGDWQKTMVLSDLGSNQSRAGLMTHGRTGDQEVSEASFR